MASDRVLRSQARAQLPGEYPVDTDENADAPRGSRANVDDDGSHSDTASVRSASGVRPGLLYSRAVSPRIPSVEPQAPEATVFVPTPLSRETINALMNGTLSTLTESSVNSTVPSVPRPASVSEIHENAGEMVKICFTYFLTHR